MPGIVKSPYPLQASAPVRGTADAAGSSTTNLDPLL